MWATWLEVVGASATIERASWPNDKYALHLRHEASGSTSTAAARVTTIT